MREEINKGARRQTLSLFLLQYFYNQQEVYLTNNEWVKIDQRKKSGERLADILSELKVLYKFPALESLLNKLSFCLQFGGYLLCQMHGWLIMVLLE